MWRFWRLFYEVWMALWSLSLLQIPWLFGHYSPVVLVLTPSDMPYAPPLSLLILAPGPPPADGAPHLVVSLVPTSLGLQLPLVHYALYADGQWWYYVPNAKTQLWQFQTPLAPLYYVYDMLPPYGGLVEPGDPSQYVAHAVFVVPGYPIWILQIIALMAPKMVERFRRVF